MSIIANIQRLCKENNTTIPKLEKEFKFGNGAMYRWETNSPSIDKLQKVAEYFDVSIDSLLAETYTVEDENNKEELKKFISSKGNEPYIILSAKAQKKGMPTEVLEKLIELYSK